MNRRGAVRRSGKGDSSTLGDPHDELERSTEAVAYVSSEEEGTAAAKEGAGRQWDRKVYEDQLAKLQEQLEVTLIEKSELQTQLKELEEDRHGKKQYQAQKKELEKLTRENEELRERLKDLSSTVMSNIELQTQVSMDKERSKDKRPSLLADEGSRAFEEEAGSGIKRSSAVFSGKESPIHRRRSQVADVSSSEMPPVSTGTSLMQLVRSAQVATWDWLCQLASDFSENSVTSEGSLKDETVPFSVKRLKSNLTRVGKAAKPLTEFITYVMGVLQFKNRAETLVVFLVYMYCVWNGWVIQLLLLMAILKLTLNYLYESHLAEQFGFYQESPVEDTDSDKSLSDTVQLVRQVAQTVQNISGQIADALEKLTNLVRWHPANVTAQIYRTLWIIFVCSLILPNGYVLSSLGVFLGVKIFIIDIVYAKYPKVKERYDSVTKMYRLLMTNEQLETRCGDVNPLSKSLSTRQQSLVAANSEVYCAVTSEDCPDFCAKFGLDELPLAGWQSGRRCTLMDREKPLIGSKGGTLYLTHSCLCFESKSSEKIIIRLADITAVNKSKQFSILPGSGMAIEVTQKQSDKPLLFGAILNRDQVLDAILEQGFLHDLSWGLDLNQALHSDPPTIAVTEVDVGGQHKDSA